jgi:putative mRNA 3-end processing factor
MVAMPIPPAPESWVRLTPAGLCVQPGGFHIDPLRPVDKAIVTHGHSDHARGGMGHVFATRETLAIMDHRIGEGMGPGTKLAYGETVMMGEVAVTLHPAGHVLGSAQVLMEYRGSRVVVSGDYKRRRDPTCPPFVPIPCDVFITEATFALPVFRHPPDAGEVARLLHSVRLFPERAHLVGVYALGKCQRLIKLLREAGWDQPIYLHGALAGMCNLYQNLGVDLGPLSPVAGMPKGALKGAIVLAPPSALQDRWARRLPDPVLGYASGWMTVKQRAKQRGVELPLVISDHADWDELTRTLEEVGAPEVWITHGNDDALAHWAAQKGMRPRALEIVGYEDEES